MVEATCPKSLPGCMRHVCFIAKPFRNHNQIENQSPGAPQSTQGCQTIITYLHLQHFKLLVWLLTRYKLKHQKVL